MQWINFCLLTLVPHAMKLRIMYPNIQLYLLPMLTIT